ncbi:hypothetical protein Bwad004_07790 [Bilophila wadsworthia]
MALSDIQRVFADILDSIWGKDAQTSIPTQPVSGIAYRDTAAEFETGQKYDSLGESSRWNQLLYLLTGLTSELANFGILPWSAAQPYSKGALCIGSDGTLWQAQIDIAASPTNPVPPGTDDNIWSRPKISGFVPDSIRVIAGTGMTGGGPLSADVTLAAKLTDSVSSTDSTTAASATAVKTAYDAAQAKLPLGGGVMTGSIQINDPANVIGSAPSTNTERGMFLGDKNSVIMGGVDVIQHASDNAKRAQMFAKNASGAIVSIAAVMYEDGTREISTDCPMRLSDVQIERLFADSVRLIKFSGARGNEGLAMRYSPDSGELYLDGRAVHGKADTAVYADNAGTLGGKAESALSVAYARDSGAMNGKAESALSVAFASEAQNAYALKGMDMIIARTMYTLPNYGTWKYMYLVATDKEFVDMVIGENAGGTTLAPNYPAYPSAFMDGIAFRSA